MRVNLNVPYAQKDEAKKLGARWDPARKIWYVIDVEDLNPFMRWIKKPQAVKPILTKPTMNWGVMCDCEPAWEYCVHNPEPSLEGEELQHIRSIV